MSGGNQKLRLLFSLGYYKLSVWRKPKTALTFLSGRLQIVYLEKTENCADVFFFFFFFFFLFFLFSSSSSVFVLKTTNCLEETKITALFFGWESLTCLFGGNQKLH